MLGSNRLSFAFGDEGPVAGGPAEMTVTYVGRFNRKRAEADAWRRFEEWRRLSSPLAKRRTACQLVLE